jgi:hypothetical protein
MRKVMLDIANNSSEDSFVSSLRRKRFSLFESLVKQLAVNNNEITVLDVGGTSRFWKQVYDVVNNPLKLRITLLNLFAEDCDSPIFNSISGDALNINEITERYDICFSNSLLEHVGDLPQKRLLIQNMKTLSKTIYLQTPALTFPVEPHYQVLFIHWLPLPMRLRVLNLCNKSSLTQEFENYSKDPINLSSKNELEYLFSGTDYTIHHERLFCLTKSYVVIAHCI